MGAIGIFEFGDERHEVQLNIVGQTLAKVRVRNRMQTFVGTFQAGYIEQLTQKTGAFKSFPQFCQLLIRKRIKIANISSVRVNSNGTYRSKM